MHRAAGLGWLATREQGSDASIDASIHPEYCIGFRMYLGCIESIHPKPETMIPIRVAGSPDAGCRGPPILDQDREERKDRTGQRQRTGALYCAAGAER